MLDSGTARGFMITNNARSIPHRVEGRNEERNAGGSHRGESFRVSVTRLSSLEKSLGMSRAPSPTGMFSSEPFDGTVGLDFFQNRRLTLDYRSGRTAATT
jgi:hypothetical protein